jgi:hypothetical protein
VNLSNFLPGFMKRDDENTPFDQLPPERQAEILAAEKAERIKFHRENVRNGPRKFGHLTMGRHISKERRREASQLAKKNRKYRRDWMNTQQQLARLRGQLEVVGALPVYRLADVDGRKMRVADRIADHPLRRNGLQGLWDGFAAAAGQEFHGGDELDIDNPDHVATVVDFALHHYTLATTGRAA